MLPNTEKDSLAVWVEKSIGGLQRRLQVITLEQDARRSDVRACAGYERHGHEPPAGSIVKRAADGSTGSFEIFTVTIPSATLPGSVFPGILSITDLDDNVLGEASFSVTSAVPEPSPFVLLAFSILLCAGSAIRRTRPGDARRKNVITPFLDLGQIVLKRSTTSPGNHSPPGFLILPNAEPIRRANQRQAE